MPRKILSWPDCCSLPSSKKTDKKKSRQKEEVIVRIRENPNPTCQR
jgi:hypothetical protein